MRTARLILAALLPLAFAACRGCERTVSNVAPTASVTPRELRFGKIKVGAEGAAAFKVAAVTQAALSVESPQLGSGGMPGGAEGFSLGISPTLVAAFEELPVPVTFRPAAEQAYEAVVTLRTNDPETPVHSVLLTGEGALPHLAVTPQCDPAVARCIGLPPVAGALALDFGPQPRRRASPVSGNRLPSVALVNEGDVELVISSLAVTGPDAAAFVLRGAQAGVALALQGGEGVNVPIDFVPTSESQAAYVAELVITSDDPARAEVRVGLAGTLRPNRPPTVCANVVQVKPGDGSLPLQFDTAADWAPLLAPPPGGYDFTSSREVVPLSEVKLSALSSTTDTAACTADEEDPRESLTWKWELVEAPPGSATGLLSGAATPVAIFRPVVTGDYLLRLTVTDTELSATAVPVRLRVARKEDLVAQLSWAGAGGFTGVDLDLHLVRPSSAGSQPLDGVFSFFEQGTTPGSVGTTSGDLNGYAAAVGKNLPGFNFDWGQPGSADDPRLNVDDTGLGQLVENISLNDPEHDAACAADACRYKVLVHFFKDARAPAGTAACTVDSTCSDGAPCQCGGGEACVANDAPAASAPAGAGRCLAPPAPVVRLYFRGRPIPAAELPLAPEAWTLGAPCQVLHVADVIWPRAGAPDGGTALDGGSEPVVLPAGPATAGAVGRFGLRSAGDLACSPDLQLTVPSGKVSWYGPAPR